MTEIVLTRPIEPSSLSRLLHGSAVLLVTLGILLLGALTVSAVFGGAFDARADLAARAQKIATLETALKTQQSALGHNLQLIGAPHGDWKAVLSPTGALEILNQDADALIGALESFGFGVSSRTEPTARPLTETLAIYTLSLSFAGDQEAAAALFSADQLPNLDIANLHLQNNVAAAPQSVTLSLELERIGAAQRDDAAENGGAPDE